MFSGSAIPMGHVSTLYDYTGRKSEVENPIWRPTPMKWSVLEYTCPVWHPGLSEAQANEIERVQKRCLKIIYPERTYTEAFLISGLNTLQSRRENMNITRDLFREIKDENHILHSLLPKTKNRIYGYQKLVSL